jgi:hypothetical protein
LESRSKVSSLRLAKGKELPGPAFSEGIAGQVSAAQICRASHLE